jgi:hypothetical protein
MGIVNRFGVSVQPLDRNAPLWSLLNEKCSEKCSHTPVCCAFSEHFSFKSDSKLDVRALDTHDSERLRFGIFYYKE